MFKHVLVPIDGSELSTSTVKRAVAFGKGADAKLTFYFAQAEYSMSLYSQGMMLDPAMPEKYSEITKQQAEKILSEAKRLADQAGVSSATLTNVSNAPYLGIIDAAASSNCDLIFMASHGHCGLSSILLGSETHKVLTHASIPVLVYR